MPNIGKKAIDKIPEQEAKPEKGKQPAKLEVHQKRIVAYQVYRRRSKRPRQILRILRNPSSVDDFNAMRSA